MAIRWDGLDAGPLCACVCIYISVWVYLCVSVCDVLPVIIGKSNLLALHLPSTQQLERGEPEFSMSSFSVMARTCEKSNTVAEPRFYTCTPRCGDFPPKCPTDPL